MAKGDGGNFLLEKGEKLGLGIGAGVGVLLVALGIMSIAGGSQDPEKFANDVEAKAKNIKAKMDSKDAKIDELKADIQNRVDTNPLALVATRENYFDPTQPPDGRRISPIVLTMAEGTADFAALKILANDIKLTRDEDGNVINVTVGVVAAKDDSKIEGAGKFIDDIRRKGNIRIPPKRKDPGGAGFPGPGGPSGPGFPGGGGMAGGYPSPPGMGMGGGAGLPGGAPGPGGAGFGGGGPSGPGMPGMPRGGGFRGGMGGPGMPGMGGPGMPGMGDMYGSSQGGGRREHVIYIEGKNDEEIERNMKGNRLAITIRPQRMAVLQGSFPYRAQLAKYQAALRYAKLEDLYAHPDDMPTFNGVDVQRRLYRPKHVGSSELDLVEDWHTVDLVGGTNQDLRAVKLYYNEDSADLKRVMLHEDHMLVMPLPHEIAGKYPDEKLKTLDESIKKMKKQDAKATSMPPPKTRFQGDANPFKRDSAPDSSLYNPGGNIPGLLPPTGGKQKKDEDKSGAPAGPPEPPDYIFVRVYDTDVRDGYVHEYRMRVKLKNPNYGKNDQVSKKSDADMEELPPLDEHWYVFPQKVSVPQGGYHYVVDWTKPDPKAAYSLRAPRDGEAIIQFQRWYDYMDLSERVSEPIGDWVLADMLATRGMYVKDATDTSKLKESDPRSGKAFTPVPFWSSVDNAFVLREIPGDPKPPKGKEQRKGAVIEPIRAKALLTVEVAGGKVSARIPPNPGQATNRTPRTDDDAATEVLFMYPDGTLEYRNSARDKGDPDRKDRETKFRQWVKDTEEKVPVGTPAKGKNDF